MATTDDSTWRRELVETMRQRGAGPFMGDAPALPTSTGPFMGDAAELPPPNDPGLDPAAPSRNQRCHRCTTPIDISDDEHAVEAGVYTCETCMTKPPAAPRRAMPMGPPLSEDDALASVERALERLFPVHDLRLVVSASDEVKEAICATYRRKGFEAKPIPQGIWLNQDEDGKAAQAELDEDDKRRWSNRAADERLREFLRDEETRS